MSRREDSLSRAQRTRTGRVWAALLPAIAFLILLIIFIAENGQHVQVKFFGASGSTYVPVAADVGEKLRAVTAATAPESGTFGGGSDVTETAATAPTN